jgi:hypothetical protein
MSPDTNARVVAFYLPQFHPIPENDEWWGKGFTEWTNVAKAQPLFRGHHQPNVPADLGFYDLRVPEVRELQAEIARRNGIEAFCYYHYWFAGKRLLERPFNEVVSSGKPNFGFCLCWANQTWTGVWHGAPNRILVEQTYPGEQDHIAHFRALEPAFHDPRYLTIDGMPVFIIYNPEELPECRKTLELWRGLACKSGLKGLFLVGNDLNLFGLWTPSEWLKQDHGFDAIIWTGNGDYEIRRQIGRGIMRRVLRPWPKMQARWNGPRIYPYGEISEKLTFQSPHSVASYPCVVHSWDNTPRSGRNGLVLTGATPELFRPILRKAIRSVEEYRKPERFVYLKSWNEWAEGNYLEPDLRWGHKYLDVIRAETISDGG